MTSKLQPTSRNLLFFLSKSRPGVLSRVNATIMEEFFSIRCKPSPTSSSFLIFPHLLLGHCHSAWRDNAIPPQPGAVELRWLGTVTKTNTCCSPFSHSSTSELLTTDNCQTRWEVMSILCMLWSNITQYPFARYHVLIVLLIRRRFRELRQMATEVMEDRHDRRDVVPPQHSAPADDNPRPRDEPAVHTPVSIPITPNPAGRPRCGAPEPTPPPSNSPVPAPRLPMARAKTAPPRSSNSEPKRPQTQGGADRQVANPAVNTSAQQLDKKRKQRPRETLRNSPRRNNDEPSRRQRKRQRGQQRSNRGLPESIPDRTSPNVEQSPSSLRLRGFVPVNTHLHFEDGLLIEDSSESLPQAPASQPSRADALSEYRHERLPPTGPRGWNPRPSDGVYHAVHGRDPSSFIFPATFED